MINTLNVVQPNCLCDEYGCTSESYNNEKFSFSTHSNIYMYVVRTRHAYLNILIIAKWFTASNTYVLSE